jgi:misshapen/NIK-related kinase
MIEKRKVEEMNNKIRLEKQQIRNSPPSKVAPTTPQNHKRQESDSKLSLNFVRGFRRENSDFFPLSKRHSAVLSDNSTASSGSPSKSPITQNPQFQRSSAIFQRNRNKGEPILTDFSVKPRDPEADLRQESPKVPLRPQRQSVPMSRNLDFLRPRREKTESVIFLRNSPARQQLFDDNGQLLASAGLQVKPHQA